MAKRIFKIVIYITILFAPAILFAQSSPPPISGDPDVTPIDQQTLLLASGGLIYAVHKIRESRKKKKVTE